MPAEQFEWTNSRGNRLACYAFMPPVTRAVLVYHHGFAEHTQRKREVFEQLAASGIAVYTYDMYGHGLSEPQAAAERAWVQDWNHMVDDLCGFADIARKRHASCNHLPTDNWFIGGYSIGGLTAAHAVLRQPGQWKGTVLIAAALGLHKHGLVTHIQAALAPLLYATVPKRKIVKALETSQLNPNSAWVADYEADPLCYHDKIYLGTAYQFGQALEDLQKHKQDFKVPAFIIHATGDRITDCQAVQDFASGLTDITFETIEAGYHDIVSKGPLQQSSLAKTTQWILATAGATAGALLLN